MNTINSNGPDIRFTSDITVRLIQQCGNDATIAGAAWVSTTGIEASTRAAEDQAKVRWLIRYLMQHRHGSPFEHGMMTMYVHAPIFVWREWHRHRIGFAYTEYGSPEGDGTTGMSFNEESARYKVLDPVFYIPPSDRPMVKVENWKPGRPKFLTLMDAVAVELASVAGLSPSEREEQYDTRLESKYREIVEDMKAGYAEEYPRYLRQLARDLDPGLARDNLPFGIYSACWVTANPRSLMHFLSLRTHEPTAAHVSYPLYEIDVAARQVESLFAKYWPETHAAWVECGRVAP